ncbi:MAG: DNA polymerase I, partial [Clostridia bacterium]|nr:DNA polymerase I [Clostridia bacterium]
MKRLIVIDGNSILNRAFYGIMGSKMLQTSDGTYTNAVYGFLSILFKIEEDLNPEYLVVAFDLKAPTKRHLMYKEYKGTRKGMPEELAQQMPIIKKVLTAMNIKIITKEGYEADDVLGTLSRFGEENGLEVTLLTGDRDSFQLATDKTIIRIPRTKQGKTETEDFDKNKIIETYGVLPTQLIEVKGLQGDTSDNIPGVPGIGEKTALNLIKEYKSIDELYEKLEKGETNLKGKQKENIEANKELALLSRELGRIDVNAPIEKNLEEFKVIPWNKEEVLTIFKELRFNRYIERFSLNEDVKENTNISSEDLFNNVIILEDEKQEKEVIGKLLNTEEISYYFETEKVKNYKLIIKEEIKYINIYYKAENTVYTMKFNDKLKEIFESKKIQKNGEKIKIDYVLLKQNGINPENISFDTRIAGYLLNSVSNAYSLEELSSQYLNLEIENLFEKQEKEEKNMQTSLFDTVEEIKEENIPNYKFAVYAYVIGALKEILINKLEEINSLKLFNEIEIPTAEVLADMQYQGIYIDERELIKFGESLKSDLEELRIDIYEQAGEEFNINSTKQLGEILFDKLKLTASKKTKSGYSTDVEALEKIVEEHPIIQKILDYRQIMKLNSTYVEGMIPHINEETGRIHTFFHQTVTATGRISSTDPNLQNIPTRTDLGKKLRKVFKAEKANSIFIDADYSQIELRVLAHMSNDEIMVKAFNEDSDIHTICASQIFGVPVEEVSKQLRSRAKAVNFGI